MTHSTVSPLAAKQAAHILKARTAGTPLAAFTVHVASLESDTGWRTIVVVATDDKGAREVATRAKLAPGAARPAVVRDLESLIAAALAAAPTVAPVATTPKLSAFDKEWAALLAEEAALAAAPLAARRYWTTGEGARPALPAAASTFLDGVAGLPRRTLTARPRPGAGAPFVGDGSKVRPGQGTRLAHEHVPARPSAPVWTPTAAAV